MKKFIYGVITLTILFFGTSYISALGFHYGPEISDEYITYSQNKFIKGNFHLRYIYDDNNRVVFCIEPHTSIIEGSEYTEYQDIYQYSNLSKAQLDRIKLIVFYGYGNPERQNDKWFSITQFKIWETILPNGYIKYTDSSYNVIDKYQEEMAILEEEIKNHNEKPTFIHDYQVRYKGILTIPEFTEDYEILNSIKPRISFENGFLKLSAIKEPVTLSVRKKIEPRFNDNFVIYESLKSQNIITPGDVTYPTFDFNVSLYDGKAIINVNKIDDVYTIESEFSGTCYNVYKDGKIYDGFCPEGNISHEINYLPYGTYEVKQSSHGIGYRADNETYYFTIDENNNPAILTINNYLIRNTIKINKSYCQEENCLKEANAVFRIYDKFDNMVDELVTDKLGTANITLGYGKYTVKQISGLENYTLAENYDEHILDEETDLSKDLYNYYIEPDVPETPPIEEEVIPPKTGVKYRLSIIVIIILIALKKVLK